MAFMSRVDKDFNKVITKDEFYDHGFILPFYAPQNE